MTDSRRNIVFVVAHPDDVAFFMGGAATLLKDRYALHVLCASRGERGGPHPGWKGPGMPPPDEQVARTREAEERECCAMLGASLTFLGLIDGEIYAEREPIDRVAALLAELKPAALFTHAPLSKPDHAAGYMIALQALHRAGLFWECEMYMCTQDAFNGRTPDLFVNTTAVIEQKRALIACHRSHHTTPDSIEHWIDQDRLFGKLAWTDYAEPYLTSLPLMGQRWKRKAGSILMDLDR
jgi:LmbE family N-acetylglucosaminyl deacetylase